MKKLILGIFLCGISASCTYNVSMAHTEGSAEDVIDDNLTNTPTVSPDIKIPISGAGI
jgi:hypothetical protein